MGNSSSHSSCGFHHLSLLYLLFEELSLLFRIHFLSKIIIGSYNLLVIQLVADNEGVNNASNVATVLVTANILGCPYLFLLQFRVSDCTQFWYSS
jgi:hypothetical protein